MVISSVVWDILIYNKLKGKGPDWRELYSLRGLYVTKLADQVICHFQYIVLWFSSKPVVYFKAPAICTRVYSIVGWPWRSRWSWTLSAQTWSQRNQWCPWEASWPWWDLWNDGSGWASILTPAIEIQQVDMNQRACNDWECAYGKSGQDVRGDGSVVCACGATGKQGRRSIDSRKYCYEYLLSERRQDGGRITLWLLADYIRVLTAWFRGCSGLISFHMRAEAMFVCNVANLPKHAVFVFVTVATLNLVRVVALLLFPLLVSLVINNLVAILIWIKLVMLVILMMLFVRLGRCRVRYRVG